MENTKFVYRSNPIFNENDKELIKKWENYAFTTMVIFCKFYKADDGKQAIGYVIMYEDGWEYGSFYAHLKNLEFKEATTKALYEMLLHASELKPKEVIILTENKKLHKQMTDESIMKKKDISTLLKTFEDVKISLTDKDKIEDFDKLRDNAFSKARSGAKDTSRGKHRFRAIMLASNEEISKEESDRRLKEFAELLLEMAIKHEKRPVDEKIKDAESELKELEINQDEEPDFEIKREAVLNEIKKLKARIPSRSEMSTSVDRTSDIPLYDVGL